MDEREALLIAMRVVHAAGPAWDLTRERLDEAQRVLSKMRRALPADASASS